MKNDYLLRIAAGRLSFALAILLAASCAASRSRTLRSEHHAVETSATEETSQERTLRTQEAHSSASELSTLHEIRTVTAEAVAAEEAEIVVPLHVLGNLPDGAQFALRKGRISVAARLKSDALIVTAYSDSISRAVTSYERLDVRHFAAADSTARSETDSARIRSSEHRTSSAVTQTEVCEERRTSARRGWWFVAGAAAGVLLVLLLFLWLRFV